MVGLISDARRSIAGSAVSPDLACRSRCPPRIEPEGPEAASRPAPPRVL